jgi:hypothetical protein
MEAEPKQPRDLRAEAEALPAQCDASAGAAAARFDATAMVGYPADEAKAYYLGLGFPVVMVEPEGGSSVHSLMKERVRLVVNAAGLVVDAFLA